MSCNCGGGGLPAKITLRMEAVRLAQDANSRMDAEAVYRFLTDGVDVDALDAPPVPIATGPGPDAVVSRNALLNVPMSRVPGLPRGPVAALMTLQQPVTSLGTLAQYGDVTQLAAAIGESEAGELTQALQRYGLRVGMSADELRQWVLEGA